MPDYIKQNIDLSKHCTFRIGGNAKYFVEIDTKEKLIEVFNWIKKNNLKYFVLGGGSNVLFDDKGFNGIILKMINNELIGFKDDGMYLVSAGYSFSKFVSDMNNAGFFTSHWLGIPGTVGGAIAVNAGPADGGFIGDSLISALIFDINKNDFVEVDNDWFEFEYRNTAIKSGKKKAIIWSAILKLHKRYLIPEDVKNRYENHIKSKLEFQSKIEGFNAGCFFKNINNISTGKLIDEAGLKGLSCGDAAISMKHGNFIINKGKATSKDVLNLVEKVKSVIKDKYNLDLENEVIIVDY